MSQSDERAVDVVRKIAHELRAKRRWFTDQAAQEEDAERRRGYDVLVLGIDIGLKIITAELRRLEG